MSWDMKKYVERKQKEARIEEYDVKIQMLVDEKNELMLRMGQTPSSYDKSKFVDVCRKIKRFQMLRDALNVEFQTTEESAFAKETSTAMKTTMREMKKLEKTLKSTAKQANPAQLETLRAQIEESRERLNEVQRTMTQDDEIDDEYEQALADSQVQNAPLAPPSSLSRRYDLPSLPN